MYSPPKYVLIIRSMPGTARPCENTNRNADLPPPSRVSVSCVHMLLVPSIRMWTLRVCVSVCVRSVCGRGVGDVSVALPGTSGEQSAPFSPEGWGGFQTPASVCLPPGTRTGWRWLLNHFRGRELGGPGEASPLTRRSGTHTNVLPHTCHRKQAPRAK